jgi:ABC-2 type transport system permease protein
MTAFSRTLSIYAREARAQLLATARQPQFLLPTLVLPVMFYALFGVAFARGRPEPAHWLLATYAVFAALGPGMFGFGAGVAAEREAGQLELKRASPMPSGAYVAGKLAASMALAALALLPICAVALGVRVSMPAWRWAAVVALGAVSAVPFGLIGLNLGLRLGAQGAVAAANLLFMVFGMLGGLWIPLSQLPHWMTRLAWILPSFHLGQLSLGLAGVLPPKDVIAHLAVLFGICVLAIVGAWAAWRREEA